MKPKLTTEEKKTLKRLQADAAKVKSRPSSRAKPAPERFSGAIGVDDDGRPFSAKPTKRK